MSGNPFEGLQNLGIVSFWFVALIVVMVFKPERIYRPILFRLSIGCFLGSISSGIDRLGVVCLCSRHGQHVFIFYAQWHVSVVFGYANFCNCRGFDNCVRNSCLIR